MIAAFAGATSYNLCIKSLDVSKTSPKVRHGLDFEIKVDQTNGAAEATSFSDVQG